MAWRKALPVSTSISRVTLQRSVLVERMQVPELVLGGHTAPLGLVGRQYNVARGRCRGLTAMHPRVAYGFRMTNLVIFSAVIGTVLQGGQPVAGAVVEREFRWGWKQETGTDRAETDAHGVFRFPAIKRRSLLGALLPHEPNVRQTIRVLHGGTTHTAWQFDKSNYRADGELGRPIVMTCHLENSPRRHGEVFGICELE